MHRQDFYIFTLDKNILFDGLYKLLDFIFSRFFYVELGGATLSGKVLDWIISNWFLSLHHHWDYFILGGC